MSRLTTLPRTASTFLLPSLRATSSLASSVLPARHFSSRPKQWELGGGDAWKVSPFDTDRVLYEASPRECYRNIVHLSEGGSMVSVGVLNRLLTRVSTHEDVDIAVRAIKFCRTRFVDFTENTAGYLTHACIRGGRPEVALECLEKYLELRLWAPRSCYHVLMSAFAASADTENLVRTWEALCNRKDISPNGQSVYLVLKGLGSVGEVDHMRDVLQAVQERDLPVRNGALVVAFSAISDVQAEDETSLNSLKALVGFLPQVMDLESQVQPFCTAAHNRINEIRKARRTADAETEDAEAEGDDGDAEVDADAEAAK